MKQGVGKIPNKGSSACAQVAPSFVENGRLRSAGGGDLAWQSVSHGVYTLYRLILYIEAVLADGNSHYKKEVK